MTTHMATIAVSCAAHRTIDFQKRCCHVFNWMWSKIRRHLTMLANTKHTNTHEMALMGELHLSVAMRSGELLLFVAIYYDKMITYWIRRKQFMLASDRRKYWWCAICHLNAKQIDSRFRRRFISFRNWRQRIAPEIPKYHVSPQWIRRNGKARLPRISSTRHARLPKHQYRLLAPVCKTNSTSSYEFRAIIEFFHVPVVSISSNAKAPACAYASNGTLNRSKHQFM